MTTNSSALRSWEVLAPPSLTSTPAWRFLAYREALFIVSRLESALTALVDETGEAGGASAALSHGQSPLQRTLRALPDSLAAAFGRASAAERVRNLTRTMGILRELRAWCRVVGSASPDAVFYDLCGGQLERLHVILASTRKWLAAARSQRVQIASMSALPRPSAESRTSIPTAIQQASMNDPP